MFECRKGLSMAGCEFSQSGVDDFAVYRARVHKISFL